MDDKIKSRFFGNFPSPPWGAPGKPYFILSCFYFFPYYFFLAEATHVLKGICPISPPPSSTLSAGLELHFPQIPTHILAAQSPTR